MNNKTIPTIGFVILLLIFIYQITQNSELERLAAVLDIYPTIDKIRITVMDERTIEINNNGKEMLEEFKDNLLPVMMIDGRQNKMQYNSNLGDRIYEIEFYVGSKIVFTESIYELSDGFQVTPENSLKIDDKHYIAKWNKSFIKLKMNDPDSFIEIIE